MIPIAILLGLIGGLIRRYRWWSVPAIGVIWSVMLTVGGDPNMSLPQIWIGGFLLGAANGAAGVMASWLVVTVIGLLVPQTRGDVSSRLRRRMPESGSARRLRQLSDLRERGAITDDEYESKRREILDSP